MTLSTKKPSPLELMNWQWADLEHAYNMLDAEPLIATTLGGHPKIVGVDDYSFHDHVYSIQ